MEKITKYVAFDGTEFDYKEDCAEYEFLESAKEYADSFSLYDMARKPLKVSYNEETLSNTIFIIIKEARAVPFLDNWMIDNCFDENIGRVANRLDIENCIGLWIWDSEEDTWKHWETEIAKMRELGEYFQRFEE